MKYPSLREYKAAIQNVNNINIPFFKRGSIQILLNRRGQPSMSVGGFGAVFQFKDSNGNRYALKVFTRDVAQRKERYQALHDTLQITKFPFMLDFHYLQDGLQIGTNSYPVVVMEWGRGVSLESAIEHDLQDDGIFQTAPIIAGNLYKLTKTLQEWKMGHGDFQEGNLLIDDNNKVLLIDYDGMFVPALDGKKANEIGLADYQHPKRGSGSFQSRIDDFSLLSILYQLAIIKPSLWAKHHGEKRLLLTQEDYLEPKKSELLQLGKKSPNEHVRTLAMLLERACRKDPLSIKAIEAIENHKAIRDWLVVTESTEPERQYTSLIQQVISLSDEEVEDFSYSHRPGKLHAQSNAKQLIVNRPDTTVADSKWAAIKSFFYEKEEKQKQQVGSTASFLAKMKGTLVGMFYEEGEEEQSSTSGNSSHQQNKIHASPSTTTKKSTETSAPLPTWLKRRRGK
ncbi:MAG: hypothetical protein AAF518_07165 [Spirochaetota bacterium]